MRIWDGPDALRPSRIYLGAWPRDQATPPDAMQNEYFRLISEWLANGRKLPVPVDGLLVTELILKFLDAHEGGVISAGAYANAKSAFRPLRLMYGESMANDFKPQNLKTYCDRVCLHGCKVPEPGEDDEPRTSPLSVRSVNDAVATVRRLFRWGSREGLLDHATYAALDNYGGVRRRDPRVAPPKKRTGVCGWHVGRIKPHVSKPVWGIIKLLWLTGMRPGEVLQMRPVDVVTIPDRNACWTYTPQHHKSEHRGKSRTIPLGPKAQRTLAPFMDRDPHAFCFDPADAFRDLGRAVPKGTKDYYSATSIRQSVARACKRAGVPTWHPYMLRHSVGTRASALGGAELLKSVLGHSTLAVGRHYDHSDAAKASAYTAQVG